MTLEAIRSLVEAASVTRGDAEAVLQLAAGVIPMLDELGTRPLGMAPPATVFSPGEPAQAAGKGGRGER